MSTGAGIAQGPRVRIAYGVESVRGTTPSNLSLFQLRSISRDIDLDKATLQSQEVYADRQIRDVRHGFNQVAGQFLVELSLAQVVSGAITAKGLDDMLESLLGGSWSGVGVAGGSAGTLKVGTSLNTFSFERQFMDITQYEAFAGTLPSDLALDFSPSKIIGGTLTMLGMSSPAAMSGTSIQGSGSFTNATTAPPCDTFVGAISEGGSPIALATQVSLSIKSGRAVAGVIGSRFSPDIFDGTCLVTGTLSAYFKDNSLATKFYNETPSSLALTAYEIPLSSPLTNGRRMVFTMPVIKYTGNKKQPPPQGGVIQALPFMALFDSSSGTTLQIDRYL